MAFTQTDRHTHTQKERGRKREKKRERENVSAKAITGASRLIPFNSTFTLSIDKDYDSVDSVTENETISKDSPGALMGASLF